MALILTGKWGAIADSFYLKGRLIWSIIYFRLQAALATLAGILVLIDPATLSFLDPKWVAGAVVLNAILSEWLRRRKDSDRQSVSEDDENAV